jgi:pimeloyl-ACP methyl ester carboxylesterase
VTAARALHLVARSHRLWALRFGSPSAPLVLGVHGLTGDAHQLDHLGDRLGGADLQMVVVDLRGRGRSDSTGPGSYGWESHALDLFAVADALGVEHFSLLGLSMGASVAMKAAELDGSRLEAVVLVDVAGRVDPGVGPVVESVIAGLADGEGLGVDPDAVAEDRRCTLTEDPYARWSHLTMPTLLLRATREMARGAGHVVPADDRDRFRREVPTGTIVEVDADHRTIADHPDTATAARDFLLQACATGP